MPATLAPARWRPHLDGLGFTPTRDRAGYRLNGTLFTTDNGWPVLTTAKPLAGVDPLRGQLDRPGLWKLVRSGDGVRRVFEMPPPKHAPADDGDEPADPALACLSWALATAAGKLPDGWQPPPRHEVEAWLPANGLTVQAGSLVRQGELVHRPERLALRFPILTTIPADLPAARRGWLEEVLQEGQDRWRLVRVGLAGEAAWAEVDLSGCPGPVLESLFRAGLGALRWVVEWLAGTAAFLADPAVGCRALEVCPVRALPAERRLDDVRP
jgi:hypothetical protein